MCRKTLATRVLAIAKRRYTPYPTYKGPFNAVQVGWLLNGQFIAYLAKRAR